MTKSIYYFISTFEENLDYESGKLIALTPEICTQLVQAEIPYEVLDETCLDRELKKDSRSYFFDQVEWFRDFNEFLKRNIEYCRTNDASLATAHYNQIKYLMDSATCYSYVLRRFIEKHAPEKIIHVTTDSEDNPNSSIYSIFSTQTTLIAKLLPHVCKNLGVPFELKVVSRKEEKGKGSLSLLKGAVKNILLKLHVKSLLSFLRFQKYRSLTHKKKPMKGLGVLFLHSGCFSVDEAVRQSLFAGARVFTMGKDVIYGENGLMHKRISIQDKGDDNLFAEDIKAECNSAAQMCRNQHGLFSWVQEKSGVNVDDFLDEYLSHFISDICYDTILKTERLVEFYDRNKIDIAVMRSSSGYDSAFTLTAAKMRPHIKRVCIQHSCAALDGILLPMTELAFFDYYLSTEGLSEDYFNYYRRKYDIMQDCQVKQTAHYFKSIEDRYQKKPGQKGRERIIFAPSDAAAETSMGISNFNLQSHWNGIEYFRYIRQILTYMAERQDKVFIFKYRSGHKLMERLVLPYVASQGYTNIIVESRPLASCFHLAQRVILDYPSSGLYEASAAGLPVMSIYKRHFATWPDAVKFFGDSLRPYENIQDAKKEIENFLNSDSSGYMHKLPLSGDTVIDVLCEIAKDSRLKLKEDKIKVA